MRTNTKRSTTGVSFRLTLPDSSIKDLRFSAESLAGGRGFPAAGLGRRAADGGDGAICFSFTGVFAVEAGDFAGSATTSYEECNGKDNKTAVLTTLLVHYTQRKNLKQ